MEPVVVQQTHVYLLAGVEAGEGVVEDGQVKTTFLAEVLVAAGPPVLPLPYLQIFKFLNFKFFFFYFFFIFF